MKQTIEFEVPEGYELIKDNYFNDLSDNEILDCRILFRKKEEIKDFHYYIDMYMLHTPNNIIDFWGSPTANIFLVKQFIQYNFNSIPFEIKIGLLKFICDDIAPNDFFSFVIDYCNGCKAKNSDYIKIRNICPKEFLESMFYDKS
jgi:hypothetical protein